MYIFFKHMKKIIEFAKEHGYETAIKTDDWNGYECYEPIMDKDNVSYIGPPLFILVKGDEIRMSTPDEALAHLSGRI